MGQTSATDKGVLPPLKDLGVVEVEPEVELKRVEFEGNTVFSDQELQGLVKGWLGKKVSIEELEGVRKTISKHYFDNRYVNSGAVIDAQDFELVCSVDTVCAGMEMYLNGTTGT